MSNGESEIRDNSRHRFIRDTAPWVGTLVAPLTVRAAANIVEPVNQLAVMEKPISLIGRPSQLEMPLHYFREYLHAHRCVFVHWHKDGIPTAVTCDSGNDICRVEASSDAGTPWQKVGTEITSSNNRNQSIAIH
jgi:hypothetical protein